MEEEKNSSLQLEAKANLNKRVCSLNSLYLGGPKMPSQEFSLKWSQVSNDRGLLAEGNASPRGRIHLPQSFRNGTEGKFSSVSSQSQLRDTQGHEEVEQSAEATGSRFRPTKTPDAIVCQRGTSKHCHPVKDWRCE